MTFDDLLGLPTSLRIVRFTSAGAYLGLRGGADVPGAPTVLLPGKEIPENARIGDEVDVFLYRDSEDRPIATTTKPKLALDDVAFLTVTSCTRIGAFVDWGLPKELLVPFAEQTRDLRVGDREPIGLYLDNSRRLTGTMRIAEMLEKDTSEFARGEWVEGEAWRNDPSIGLFVIVERGFVGLVPRHEPHALSRGEASRFRVTQVLPDGKIELSLRGLAHEQLATDAARILEVLARKGAPRVSDRTDPDELRRHFGLSKKAFKRALGTLLKRGDVTLDGSGFVTPSRRPGAPPRRR